MTIGETRRIPAPDDSPAPLAVAPRNPWLTLGRHVGRGVSEIILIGLLYVVYCVSRTIASTALTPAHNRAAKILAIEKHLGIAWEHTLNHWFVTDRALAVFGSYWYATMHYIVTLVVLIWLYSKGQKAYLPARRALVAATLIALGCFLLIPTMPPRLFGGGYVDILRTTANVGWWGGAASAPKGLGQLTNQLAAFPSLHSGWALWVAIVLWQNASWRFVRYLGWLYAATMAFVIVGTANHWVLDTICGWLVVGIGYLVVRWMPAEPVPLWRRHRRSSSTSAADSL